MNLLRSRVGSLVRLTSVAFFTVVTTGCFDFVASPVAQAPVGETVRLNFDDPVEVPLGEVNVRDGVQVEGALIDNDGSNLRVVVTRVTNRNGSSFIGGADVFQVRADRISALQTQQLNSGKTIGMVVGLAAAFTGIMLAVFGGDNDGGGNNGGDPIIRPMLSIPIPIR